MRRWTGQLTSKQNSVTPKSNALTTEQQRIQALEKHVKRREMKKDILKKATAFLI